MANPCLCYSSDKPTSPKSDGVFSFFFFSVLCQLQKGSPLFSFSFLLFSFDLKACVESNVGVCDGVILVTDMVIWTMFQEISINRGRKLLHWNLV